MKTHKSKYAAKTEVNRRGPGGVPYEIKRTKDGEYYPHFFCIDSAQLSELRSQKFSAEYNPVKASQ